MQERPEPLGEKQLKADFFRSLGQRLGFITQRLRTAEVAAGKRLKLRTPVPLSARAAE